MCYNYDKLQFRNSSSDFPQRPCNFHALSNPDPVNTLPQGMSMDHGGIMTALVAHFLDLVLFEPSHSFSSTGSFGGKL